MGVLGDDPLFLRRLYPALIKEALGLAAAKDYLAQIYRVIQNDPNGGGVPVVGLAPVVAVLVVVWVVLIEVCLGIQHTP